MFRWDEDMIRFLRDASEQSDYHRLLAETLAGRLPADAHVCDAGCGLGYLSLRLAPYCRRVTAVDVCEAALAVLRENCAKEGITNIMPRCGEIDTLPPDAAAGPCPMPGAGHPDQKGVAGSPVFHREAKAEP